MDFFNNVQQCFIVFNVEVYLFKFFLNILFFLHNIVNVIVFLIFFSDCSLLIYRKNRFLYIDLVSRLIAKLVLLFFLTTQLYNNNLM